MSLDLILSIQYIKQNNIHNEIFKKIIIYIIFISFFQAQIFSKELIYKSTIINDIDINGIISSKKAKHIKTKIDEASSIDFSESVNFENVFLYDNFRIFYTNYGEHKLLKKFKSDKNKNSVPDFIEDIMTELVVTKNILESYGFKLLKNHTLYDDIEYINLIITNSSNKKEKSAYYYGHKKNRSYKVFEKNQIIQGKSILLRVHQEGRRIKKSVSHELFHAYQYANTNLLNNWFVEGTAVWFEYALSKGTGKEIKELPYNIKLLKEKVLSKAYKASAFWNRITKLCSSNNRFKIPNKVDANSHYLLHSNELVVSDNLLYGLKFMKVFFDNLYIQNKIASNQYKNKFNDLNYTSWPKSFKKSNSNNKYILQALKKTIISECDYEKNSELKAFVSLINNKDFNTLFDANSDDIRGWAIEDTTPKGAKIEIVFNKEINKNVIKFNGSGIKNGYRFLKGKINDIENKIIKLNIKSSNRFAIYIKVLTQNKLGKNKFRSLVYSNYIEDSRFNKSNYYKNFNISTAFKQKNWNLIIRDLGKDLMKSEANNSLISVVDIFVRGNIEIDTIKLESKKSTKYTRIHNNLNFKYLTDKKCKGDIIYAKNIWDMKEYKNKIYIATGNSRNIAPACNAGPVPLISLELNSNKLKYEIKNITYIPKNTKIKNIRKNENFIKEEKIEKILAIDEKLMIPGHDPTQNWSFGNIYIKENIDENWAQYRTLKNVVHAYDIELFDNKLFVAGSQYNNKTFEPFVAQSIDSPLYWKYYNFPYKRKRVFNLLKINNRLLATTTFNDKNISTFEYKFDKFIPNIKFDKNFFFPNTKFDKNNPIKIFKDININKNELLYIGRYMKNEHIANNIGLYRLRYENHRLKSSKISFQNFRVLDFNIFNEKVYILVDNFELGVYNIKVFISNKENLVDFKELVSFTSRNIIRSFEVTKDYLYFGVGIELDKKNNYFPNSIKEDTGDILKMKFKFR